MRLTKRNLNPVAKAILAAALLWLLLAPLTVRAVPQGGWGDHGVDMLMFDDDHVSTPYIDSCPSESVVFSLHKGEPEIKNLFVKMGILSPSCRLMMTNGST